MATTAHADSASTSKVTSGPVQMNFDRSTEGGTHGTFNGRMKIGSLGLMEVEGPITCLDVRGNKVGMFYPITKSSPFLMTATKSGVYMNMTTDDSGNVKSIAYSVVPFKTTGGCKPAPTFMPASGNVSLTDDG